MKINQKIISFILFVILIILNLSFLSSENLNSLDRWRDSLSESDKSILQINSEKYESRILDEFAKIEGTNESFVRAIIRLKNSSYVDGFISEFPDEEFRNIIHREVSLSSSNRFGAEITEEAFFKLIQDERVESVYYNAPIKLTLEESAELINADDGWSLGYTGDGIDVCIIDSGIDLNHVDLPVPIAEHCYHSDNGCHNGGSEETNAMDDYGHGTRVAGVVGSQDLFDHGIAHDSDLYVVRVMDDDGEGNLLDVADAIDWCRNQGVNIISMSFEDGPYSSGNCPSTINTEIANAYNAGITLVAGSGNDNQDNKIGYPACNNQVISVGASYDVGNGSVKVNWCDAMWEGYLFLGGCWLGDEFYTNEFSCKDYPEVDNIACWSNRNSNLDSLAPGYQITTTQLGGGFTSSYVGTSLSTPMVAGAAALLLEKNSSLSPDEIKYILQTTGVSVYDPETEMTFKRINVSAALNSICVCDEPTPGLCGSAGGCDEGDRRYTTDCDPSGCDTESYCSRDPTCDEGTPPGVSYCKYEDEYDEYCPSGYEATDHYCDPEGTYHECELECWKEELSDWKFYDSDSGTGAGWRSDGTVYCDDLYVDDPASYEDLKVETEVGYWYSAGSDQNKVRWGIEFNNSGVYMTSSCSNHVSSYAYNFYPSDCSSSCKVESKVNIYKGESNCDNLCDGSCEDANYGIECLADLYYKEYEDVYEYLYCDVPYTKTITIDSTIYGNTDADCYVEVQGDESHPDKIRVRWYINEDYSGSETCDESGGDECDDTSGYTWDHTFTLSNSYYSKGDEVYCIARGYGEDDGHGAYASSSTTTVSNRVPTWSSISLDKSIAKQGDNIKVTASGEADLNSDVLAMYCCNGDSCTPTTSAHDFCYVVGDSYPYDLYCTGQGISGDGTKTVRCRIYDGDDYSTIKLATYTADNTAPNVTIISPLNQSYNITSINFNVSITENGSCMYSLNNETNISMNSTDNQNFYAINSSMTNGNHTVNFYCNDSVGNINYNESVNFTVSAPTDTYKFYLRDNVENPLAWLGNEGNIALKGSCFSGGSCDNPGPDSFIIRNSTDNYVAFINSTGDLCVESGDCSDQSATCNTNPEDAFIVRNSTDDNVIYIDKYGDLCLIGGLYENSL